jgi:ligand-binding sensor domain-containing protein
MMMVAAFLQVAAQEWSLQTNVYDCRDAAFVGDNLWVATTGGLCQYSDDGTLLHVYTSADDMDHTFGLCLDNDAAGNLYVGTGHFVSKFDGVGFTSIEPQAGVGYGVNGVGSIGVDNNDILRFHTWDGVSIYENGTVTTVPLGYNFMSFGVKFSKDGMGWYVSNTQVINQFDGTNSIPLTNGHPAASDIIYFDGISFNASGVPYVTAMVPAGQPPLVMHYDGSSWIMDTDLKKGVMAFDQDNNIWIASNDTLFKYDAAHNLISTLKLNYVYTNWQQYVILKHMIVKNDVVWVFTNAGILKCSGTTVEVILPNMISPGKIKGISQESGGKIWVCSEYGISSYEDNVWTGYPNSVTGMLAGALFVVTDQNNTKWFGTYEDGIAAYNGSTWTYYNMDNTPALTTDYFICAAAGNNMMWFGTQGHGIYSFNGTAWTHYTTANGLPAETIRGIHANGTGDVWCATAMGTAKLSGSTWSLVDAEPSWSVFSDASGHLYAGHAGFLKVYDGSDWTTISQYKISGLGYLLGFGNIEFTSFDEDNDGNIWMGYAFAGTGGGYFYYDGTDVFDPDPDNVSYVDAPVYTICAMSNNEIWIGALGCTILNPAGTGIGDGPAYPSGPRIYPNPAADFITIDLEGIKEVSRYFILGIDGRIALQGEIGPDQNRIRIIDLSTGTYMLKISNSKTTTISKFVKK